MSMIDTLPFAESNTMHPQVQFQQRGSLDAMQSEPKQHESAGTHAHGNDRSFLFFWIKRTLRHAYVYISFDLEYKKSQQLLVFPSLFQQCHPNKEQ